MSFPVEFPELFKPISWICGHWKSTKATVSYPTIKTMQYIEEMSLIPASPTMCGPFLEYNSVTWDPEKKIKMHQETGYLRLDPKSPKLAFLVAHNFGITELSEGSFDPNNGNLNFISSDISSMSFSENPNVRKIVRNLKKINDSEFALEVCMETSTQPLQTHLVAEYKKID